MTHALASQNWAGAERALVRLPLLEKKVEEGANHRLLDDFALAGRLLPQSRRAKETLRLIEAGLRIDAHFLSRHPSAMFQSLWNTCWWYDCAEAEAHYASPGCRREGESRDRGDRRLSGLLEDWRRQKEANRKPWCWLRALRPPVHALDSGLLHTIKTSERHTYFAAIDLSGRVFSGGPSGEIAVWDPESGASVGLLAGHTGDITSIRIAR